MSILKTKFVTRFYNVEPRICIYDLDGTVIDSSHRATHDQEGNIDLANWIANSTKELIFNDSLMPLYTQLVNDYKNGDMVILCTARLLGEYDLEYIHSMGIYYDRIISRPKGNQTNDGILKNSQLRYLFNLPQYKDREKVFYDDNQNNLDLVGRLGRIELINPRGYATA